MGGAPSAQVTEQDETLAQWTSQSAVHATVQLPRLVQSTTLADATVAVQVETASQRTLLFGPVVTRQSVMLEQSYWHPSPQATSQIPALWQMGMQ